MSKTTRTTLTLDNDIAAQLQEEASRRKAPFRQVVNDALRRGLRSSGNEAAPTPYQLPVHACRLKPGIDVAKLNQLADELEDEATLETMSQRP